MNNLKDFEARVREMYINLYKNRAHKLCENWKAGERSIFNTVSIPYNTLSND